MTIWTLPYWEHKEAEARKWYTTWRAKATLALRDHDRAKRQIAKQKTLYWASKLQRSQRMIQTVQLRDDLPLEREASPNWVRGERSPSAKLNEEKVRRIRTGGKTSQEFADEFGVSLSAVELAKIGITWAHVR